MAKADNELHWELNEGGSNGPNFLLMLGDKYVGHFYVDADDGIDAGGVLERLENLWNDANVGES